MCRRGPCLWAGFIVIGGFWRAVDFEATPFCLAVVAVTVSWLRSCSFNRILFSTFFTLFSSFDAMSDVFDSSNIFTVKKWWCIDNVALGQVRYLAEGMGRGGCKWARAILNSKGSPCCRTISQQASVVNTSLWTNIAHPWSQMCILNSSSEGSEVGESIHLQTIYFILLIGLAYCAGLI